MSTSKDVRIGDAHIAQVLDDGDAAGIPRARQIDMGETKGTIVKGDGFFDPFGHAVPIQERIGRGSPLPEVEIVTALGRFENLLGSVDEG